MKLLLFILTIVQCYISLSECARTSGSTVDSSLIIGRKRIKRSDNWGDRSWSDESRSYYPSSYSSYYPSSGWNSQSYANYPTSYQSYYNRPSYNGYYSRPSSPYYYYPTQQPTYPTTPGGVIKAIISRLFRQDTGPNSLYGPETVAPKKKKKRLFVANVWG